MATADIIKISSCCKVTRTPQGQCTQGQNHTADGPRLSKSQSSEVVRVTETLRINAKQI